MMRAVIKGDSVTGKQTRGCFNFDGAILSWGHCGRRMFWLVFHVFTHLPQPYFVITKFWWWSIC